jgi:hypothetical protein
MSPKETDKRWTSEAGASRTTAAELRLLQIVWQREEGTVEDGVDDHPPKERPQSQDHADSAPQYRAEGLYYTTRAESGSSSSDGLCPGSSGSL